MATIVGCDRSEPAGSRLAHPSPQVDSVSGLLEFPTVRPVELLVKVYRHSFIWSDNPNGPITVFFSWLSVLFQPRY